VLVRFRLGQTFGEPGAVVQQRALVRDMLRALRTADQSGHVIELPYRWKRDTYEDLPLEDGVDESDR
jgi:D-proline reductase (dithiol) PrdB